MTKSNLTGIPSIDRPWLKFYSKDAINAPLPDCTIYEYMARANQDEPNRVALDYMGRNITYGTLLTEIDRAAVAFYETGLRQGDIVSGIVPSFPETIYCIYALNKIGVITNWFDLRMDKETIIKELRKTHTKVLLVFDEYLEGFEKQLADTDISTVISISKRDSLPIYLKLLLSLKRAPKNSRAVSYWKFVNATTGSVPETVQDASQLPAVMEYTGGTTGESKSVVLTNENALAVIHQYMHSGAPIKRDESWLVPAFPFTSYALIAGTLLPLSAGLKSVLCFSLDIKKVERTLVRKRVNHMANTPMMWEQLLHSKYAAKKDLSFIELPVVGADSLDVTREREINQFFEQHNCKYRISKGYGMTEVASGISLCPHNQANKLGSVGIPFPKTVVSIFDIETSKELSYNEVGEICISGPSVMKEYYNRPAATKEVLRLHEDGEIWMHSGDIGSIDEDGFVYIKGRLKRMFMDHMGFKIFAPQVEEVLSSIPCVEKCCVVGIDDREHKVGKIPVAYIILRNGFKEDIELLRRECSNKLYEYALPQKYIFVKKFPYTSAAKVDYRSLEQMLVE